MIRECSTLQEQTQSEAHSENHFPPAFIFNHEGVCISALGISDAHDIDIECFLGDSLSDLLPQPIATRLMVQLSRTLQRGIPERDEILLPVSGNSETQWFLSEFIPLSFSPHHRGSVIWKLTDIHKLITENEQLLSKQQTDQVLSISNEAFIINELCEELKRVEQYGDQFSLIFLKLEQYAEEYSSFGRSPERAERITVNLIESILAPDQTLARLGHNQFLLLQPNTAELKARLVAELIAEELLSELSDSKIKPRIGVLNIGQQRLGCAGADKALAYQLIEEAASRAVKS